MAGSERPREGPGSAARADLTPAGRAATGAEGGGGRGPQATPRPGPAPPEPSSLARGDFGALATSPGRPLRCVRLCLRPQAGLHPPPPPPVTSWKSLPQPTPFSTLGPKLPVGRASPGLEPEAAQTLTL